MHKRIIAFVLVFIMSLSFSGCTEYLDRLFSKVIVTSDSDYVPENSNKKNALKIDKTQLDDDVELSKHYDSIALKNGFDALETYSQRLCYLEILDHVNNFDGDKNDEGYYTSGVFTIYNCQLNEIQLHQVFDAVFQDNPHIFWVQEKYSYSLYDNYVYLDLYFTMSEQRYKKCKKQLNAVINNILGGLKKGMSDFELELYFHDYLVKNCIYDKKAAKSLKGRAFDVYGALVQQKAVCQGYTDAFQLLLSYVGINSYKISGTADGENHIWNAVQLDNKYYYVDVTWDDAQDYMMYDYFNITTKQLKKDHTIDPTYDKCRSEEDADKNSYNLLSAKCKAKKYNYYVYKGCNLKDLENNTIADDLVDTVNKGEKIFHLYINPKYLDFDTVFNQLFSQESYGFLDYIYDANAQLEYTQLGTSVYIAEKKKLDTVTVELKY